MNLQHAVAAVSILCKHYERKILKYYGIVTIVDFCIYWGQQWYKGSSYPFLALGFEIGTRKYRIYLGIGTSYLLTVLVLKF